MRAEFERFLSQRTKRVDELKTCLAQQRHQLLVTVNTLRRRAFVLNAVLYKSETRKHSPLLVVVARIDRGGDVAELDRALLHEMWQQAFGDRRRIEDETRAGLERPRDRFQKVCVLIVVQKTK